MTSNTQYCIAIMIGPGWRNYAHLLLLLESINLYEPESKKEALLLIINDNSTFLREKDLHRWFDHVVIEKNPHVEHAHFAYDRHTSHMLFISEYLHKKQYNHSFMLKLDTDVLAINPFIHILKEIVEHNPSFGIAGIIGVQPDKEHRTPFPWNRVLNEILHGVYLCIPCIKKNPSIESILRERIPIAKKNGYYLGKSVMGGAYLCSPKALSSIIESGIHPTSLMGSHLGEDVVMSLLVESEGYTLVETAELPKNPFGVWWKHPPHNPWYFTSRFSLIHSMKSRLMIRALIVYFYMALRKPAPARRLKTALLLITSFLRKRS